MVLLSKPVSVPELSHIEEVMYFEDWIKCVVDINQGTMAVNASMHADLEDFLLQQGSDRKSLYGFNIYFDPFEIEYDSLINAPRNRDAGYPRDGRGVSDPAARLRIEEIVNKWIQS